jgi:hypothetical protein
VLIGEDVAVGVVDNTFLKIWLMVMPPPLENAAGSVFELDSPALVTVWVTVWLVDEPHPAITSAATPPRTAPPVTGIHRLSLRMAICSTPDSSLAAYRTKSARQQ